ncbi:uncharacterized protein LOC129958871 [Argiope bruennichi]|uniref:uncharacterized protein LOC129958871 n=1 Tax=Argiope bruennichi TaxID=94029 RepID=UPI00249446C5|nr:uncharacterized protein LOC129958871 [Argiope bruennichi]
MGVFNSLGLCLPVLFSLLFTEITFADQRFDIVETKFIEDVCPYNDTLELFLSATGMRSALRLKNMMTKGYSNCTIVIYSALTGVIVNLDAGPYRPDAVYEGCKDYIQLVPGYNKTRNYNDKATSLVSDGNKIVFRFLKTYNGDYLERSCIILTTAYRRGNGRCSDNEFMCGSGECIWKEFQCDGQLNCPDGSDEFGPRSRICSIQVSKMPLTLHPADIKWKLTVPTTEAIEVELENTFNVAIIIAVACAFVIFFFGIIRFITRSMCRKKDNDDADSDSREQNGDNNNQNSHNHNPPRRPYATFATISVIRQRPDYRPQNGYSPPPPSYGSLIEQSCDVDPPEYSTVVIPKEEGDIPKEEDALLENEDQGMKNAAIPDPPPPYVP